MRRGAPPSSGTTYSLGTPRSNADTAIECPSGDQAGDPRTSSASDIGCASTPPTVMTCRTARALRATAKAIRRPSGEIAGAPTPRPPGADHKLVAPPAMTLHTL